MSLSADERSELAEALHDACREHIATGGRISGKLNGGCLCPFGALLRCGSLGSRTPFPNEVTIAAALPQISKAEAYSFIRGLVDGPLPADAILPPSYSDREMYDMGVQFRVYTVGYSNAA